VKAEKKSLLVEEDSSPRERPSLRVIMQFHPTCWWREPEQAAQD
jgi:hypothetical protein